MSDLIFVSGNDEKFAIAKEIFDAAGVPLRQARLDIDEVQSEDIVYIARTKAAAAYKMLDSPIIIRDDTWSLPGLRGFPGPYMKSMNHWFTTEDFLNLTRSLDDRRAILTQTLVYEDADGQKVFQHETTAELLDEARGNSPMPFENIISISGDNGRSISEVMASKQSSISRDPAKVWHEFIEWYEPQSEQFMKKPDLNRLLELQRLLLQFSQVDRVVDRHHNGEYIKENDTEHSYNLAVTAWYLTRYFPELNKEKILRFALIHDIVEIYAGDTYIYADPEQLASKAAREAASLSRLEKEWPDFPDMITDIHTYESLTDEEAKFIYALDKIMPIMLIYISDGYTWKGEGITVDRLHAAKEAKISISKDIKPYYDALYQLLLDSPHLIPKR